MMKEGLRFCGPFVFASLRAIFATICLFTLLLWRRRDLRPREMALTIAIGLLSTTGGMGIPLWSLVSGGAGKTAVLLYTMPFWALILAWPVLGEKIRDFEWLAIAVALAGLLMIINFDEAGVKLASSIMATISGICWAGSAVLTRIIRKRPGFDLISLTAWQMLFGTIPLVVLGVLVPSGPIQWTPVFIAALTYNIILTTVIAFLLWFYVLDNLPAGVATMGMLATPVVSILTAAIQLNELPSTHDAIGMSLILVGIGLLAFLGMKRAGNA